MMLTWLRSIADAVLHWIYIKPDRADTMTRMWLDADFSDQGETGPSCLSPTAQADLTPTLADTPS